MLDCQDVHDIAQGIEVARSVDTLEFEIEVGLAAGATGLRIPVGDSTTVGFAPVPPGTYYVRVRARNELGQSPASAELRIDVPQ